MRKLPIPPLLLCLLMPLFALAQTGQLPSENRQVFTSSAFWFWIAVTAIAVVAFIVSTAVISRRNWPSKRPRIS